MDKEAATRAALASFKAKRMEKLMNRLDELVGLHSVKEEVRSLVNLIRVRKMREEYHLPGMPMSYHMVFTGFHQLHQHVNCLGAKVISPRST